MDILTEILTIKGNDLEERLDSRQRDDFHVLLKQYIEDVSTELPHVVNLNPPDGLRDVIQQVDMLSVGGAPKFTDSYLFAVNGSNLIGMLSFMANGHRLFETHFGVLREYRRIGIGTSLRKEFLTYAGLNGYGECIFNNMTLAAHLNLISLLRELHKGYSSKVVVKIY